MRVVPLLIIIIIGLFRLPLQKGATLCDNAPYLLLFTNVYTYLPSGVQELLAMDPRLQCP